MVRNDLNKRDSNITALGWNTEFTISDDWSANLDLSYSKVERNDIILETNAGTGRNINGRPGHPGLPADRRRRDAVHQPPELRRPPR